LADRLQLPEPGDVIAGKYRVDCALGSGGMGAVYQVTHRVTGKRFAMKWLLPQVSAHGDAAQRFIREAQVAGRFEHPNVVEVYDVGSENDSFYMVMELLEGESLAERVDRSGPLSVADACRLLIPCMRGVAEAHNAGIVHRDLKPANIFLCRAARHMPEHAKVLDFGISKMSGGPELADGMTKSGTLIGTPHYMPLEQMRGKAVDHRADIYAFGVVLYQVLSGNLPYPADSFSDLVLMLAHDTPPPLDTIVPRMPRGLSQVIAKAMARDADDRFQNIDELIAALEPYADGHASVALHAPAARRSLDSSLSLPTPLSTESRVGQTPSGYAEPRSARGAWLAGIGAVLVLLAVVAGVVWMRRDHAELARPEIAKPEAPAAAVAKPQEPPPVAPVVPDVPATSAAAAANAHAAASPEQQLQKPETQPAAPEPQQPTAAETSRQQSSVAPGTPSRQASKRATARPAERNAEPPPAPQRIEPKVPPPEPDDDMKFTKPEPAQRRPPSRVPAMSEGDFY
jgi:serine/threonine-protein kinase